MSTFVDFELTSQWQYGRKHISAGIKTLKKNPTYKTRAISEITWGIIECIPLVGMVCALAEKKIKNNTLEGRLLEREKFILSQLSTTSFKIQNLYFHTYSTDIVNQEREVKGLDSEVQKILDNSLPDIQLIKLIIDLKEFITKANISYQEKEKLENSLKKLKDAKKTALLIGTIITTSSNHEQKELKEQLVQELLKRISHLKQGEKLIIPCGYIHGDFYDIEGLKSGDVHGHSTILEIERNESQLFNLRFFNAGDGVARHPIDSNHFSFWFPFCRYNCRAEALNYEFFKTFTNFVDGSREHSVNDIYDLLNGLGDSDIITDEISYHEQGIGNCTLKSLQIWLRNDLKNNNILFCNFNNYRLNKAIVAFKKYKKSIQNYRYTLQFGFIGKGIKNSILGFIFGHKIRTPIDKDDMDLLLEDGEKVKKVLKENKGLDTNIFANDFKVIYQLSVLDDSKLIKIKNAMEENFNEFIQNTINNLDFSSFK